MTFSRSQTSHQLARLAHFGWLAVALAASACNTSPGAEASPKPVVSAAPVLAQGKVTRVDAPLVQAVPLAAAVGVSRAAAALASAATPAAATTSKPRHAVHSSLQVKRFVVATGIKDREPEVSGDALPSDGTAIYAFAELANEVGESENVRITFERKGGTERVGDVTLPIPPSTPRHRTWAFTRFIRTAGVWEAVLWSENGAEIGRTSFEVKS